MPCVPVVDISADPGVVGAELDEVCRTTGFFQVSCLPTCLERGGRPRYEPVLAGPHLMGKFRKSVTL